MDFSDIKEIPAVGVNALAVDDEVLKQFWDLASIDQAIRQDAVKTLVARVVQDQAAFAQNKNAAADGEPPKGSEEMDEASGCSPLTKYTLRRLVRGLASNRQGARQGFALAVTHMVEVTPGVTNAAVLALMDSALSISSSMKASEARDNLLGQLFGCAAIVRAGQVQDPETASRVVTMVLAAAAKKVFLREVAAEVVLDLTDRLKEQKVMVEVLESNEAIRGLLQQPPSSATPEALLLAVRLWPLLPLELAESCSLLPTLEQPLDATAASARGVLASETYALCDGADVAAVAFFSDSHLASLLPVVRGTTAAHPRLHQLWPSLLALLLPGFSPRRTAGAKKVEAQRARGGCLEALWGVVVEGDLFTSSNERKYLGFQLFTILLPHLQTEQVPAVFSPSFLRTLTNHRSSQNSHLHSAAKRCIGRVATLRASPTAPGGHLHAALASVLARHSVFGAASSAAASSKPAKPVEDADGYVSQLRADFLAAGSSADSAPAVAVRPSLVEQLCGAARLPTAGSSSRAAVRRFLMVHAMFDIKSGTTGKEEAEEVRQAAAVPGFVAASPEVRELCASRLLSLLGSFHSSNGKRTDSAAVSSAPGGTEADPSDAHVSDVGGLSDIVQLALHVHKSSKGAKPARESTPRQLEVLQTLRDIDVTNADGEARADREAAKKVAALRHFVDLLTLYELLAPGHVDFDTAGDLAVVCRKVLQGGEDSASEDEADAPWPDALLDILLAQLARPGGALPTAPLRDAVDAVFAAICKDLTPTGLQDLMRVLTEYEEGSGPKADLLTAEDDGDVDDDDDKGEEGKDGEGPSDAESSSCEESDGEEGEKFGRLIDAVQAPDGSSSDSDGEGLDDDAMERLDGGLAAAVRAASQSKPSSVERRQQMLNFKLRAVALLEVYIRRVAGGPHLPAMLPPLLSALDKASKPAGSAALADRLKGVLGKLVRSKAATSGEGLSAADAAELLKSVLFTAARATDKRGAAAAASGFRYLLNVAQGNSQVVNPQVVAALRAALGDFFGSKKSRLPRPSVEAMLREAPSASAEVLSDVVTVAGTGRTSFLKVEAFVLVSVLLRPPKTYTKGMAAALEPQLPTLAAATVGAITSDFGKPQRHVEALKATCSCWEAAQKLQKLSDKPYVCDLGELKAALNDRAAEGREAVTPKVQTHLERLAKLVATIGVPADKTPSDQPDKGDKSITKNSKDVIVAPKALKLSKTHSPGGSSKKRSAVNAPPATKKKRATAVP